MKAREAFWGIIVLAACFSSIKSQRIACREASVGDVVFLVDGNVSPQHARSVRNFLQTMVNGFNVSGDAVRVGLAQAGDVPRSEFLLATYPRRSDVLKHIQRLQFQPGSRKTGLALRFLRDHHFQEAAGSRAHQGVPQVAVVVSSGPAEDPVREPAEALKRAGVLLYAVGIRDAVQAELRDIASRPEERFTARVPTFSALGGLGQKLRRELCDTLAQTALPADPSADPVAPEPGKAYADVVFLADTSQATSGASFQWMRSFISGVIRELEVGRDKYRIGLAQYGGQGHTEFLLSTYKTREEVIAHINTHFVLRGGPRRTAQGLRYLHQTLFQDAAGSRLLQGVPQYAVVMTSGKSEDDVWDVAQILRDRGVKVVSVGVQDFDRSELAAMGSPDLVYELRGGDGVRQLTREVSVAIHGVEEAELTAQAQEEAAVVCPTAIPADVVFLVEEFGRTGRSNFLQVVDFLKSAVSSLDVRPDVVRAGLVFYSEEPRLEFSLGTFRSPAGILAHLDRLAYRGRRGRTRTGAALDFLRREVFVPEKGSRPHRGVRRIAVVITEGFSQDNVSRPASLLRRAGVTIYAVGTQRAAERKDLDKMASYPPWKHAMPLESFLQLFRVESKLTKQLCPETPVGTTVSIAGAAETPPKDCVLIGRADVYFLIDGSGSIYPDDFLDMKAFMNEMIKMFQVGPDRVRFGVVQYSDGIQSKFTLGQYPSAGQLEMAIRDIQQAGGGTNTGEALDHMTQVFADTARAGVTRYLIVITDGKSMDPVAGPAARLRDGGVSVYAIGVRDANTTELEEIAHDQVFFVHDYDILKDIQKDVVQLICSEPCTKRKADIIFLIDGSETISPADFEKMKGFMERIVNKSDIGANGTQIGLLQFSSIPREEFRLNQYPSRVDIRRAIRRVQQMNEGTCTGKALSFTLPFFSGPRGGRASVAQYLIVITDGVAQDNVVPPAKALRDRDVVIFAIGVGNAHPAQLFEITNDQDRVFCEDNFESLKILEKKIVDEVCSPPGCNIDLSVGIDISTTSRQLHNKLQKLLPELMQQLALLSNTSCGTPEQLTPRFRYLVPGSSGQLTFDSGFEKYSDEIIQKFLVHQAARNSYMNVNFLQSLGNNTVQLSTAKVKVLMVFSDGLDDDLWRLKRTSELLRGSGLSALLIIDLGAQRLEELQELEFGRGSAYKQPLSVTLPGLPSTLLKQLVTIVERACCNRYPECPGEEGHRGDGGSPGRKGEKGFNGLPGHPGDEGGYGERGSQGLPGLRGDHGCPGARGPKGARGFSGEKGDLGDEGADGLHGEQGDRGVPGLSGEKGNTGNPGLAGPPGQPGERGDPGFRGDPGDPGVDSYIQGPKGEQGRRGHQVRVCETQVGGEAKHAPLPGDQGRSSFDGPRGETGSAGPQGPRGRQGLPGLKGVRGESGEQGRQGEIGHPGSQGPRGSQGPPGDLGREGLPGAKGDLGPPGPGGSPGKDGPRGMKGERGVAGERGPQGRPGPSGHPGLCGPDGYGNPGRKGKKGEPGFPGYPGAQGEDGDPGRRGEKGARGVRGRRGDSGLPGLAGTPGDRGPPGKAGIKGPKGLLEKTPCEIVEFTRVHCPCSTGTPKCPAFPTEVAFALDMSSEVSPSDFERMRGIVLSLLARLEISDSDCPTGARVALVSYNAKTDYLVRFSDYRGQAALLEVVRKIPLERSSSHRYLGATMRFVARHVFKRVRSGLLVRKVAVFFQAGRARDAASVSTATLELGALGITPVVISFTEQHDLPEALQVGGASRPQLFVWETQPQQDLVRMALCTLCYDPCRPAPECGPAFPGPQVADVDVAFVVDSSQHVGADVYRGALRLVDAVLDDLEVAARPNASLGGARAALVRYTVPGFRPGAGGPPVRQSFHLTSHADRAHMQRQVREAAAHPLRGAPALGHALEWTLQRVLLAAPLPRGARGLFAIVASETSAWDREKLLALSLEAKCQGVALFVLALGAGLGAAELEDLALVASAPSEQHLLHLRGVSDPELAYARGFVRAFLSLLQSGTNQYPPPELVKECGGPSRGDTVLRSALPMDRWPGGQLDTPGLVRHQEALEAADSLPEERSYVMASVAQQEAPRNYRRHTGDTEGQGQERPAKQKEIGGEATPGSYGPCSLAPMEGECQDYVLRWYYNREEQACQLFWYSSCGGNGNRFETKGECEARCAPAAL